MSLGDDYVADHYPTIFVGVIHFEKGEKREFVVRGTEAYVSAIVSSLQSEAQREGATSKQKTGTRR